MRVGVVVLLLSTLLVGACGGSKTTHAARAVTSAPGQPLPADSVAYVEIARASGALRGSAAATALGRARRLGNRATLALAAQRLAKLRAGDRGLVAVLGTTRSALAAALAASRDPRSQRAAAVTAVSATDAINRGLRGYAARHPQLRALIPD